MNWTCVDHALLPLLFGCGVGVSVGWDLLGGLEVSVDDFMEMEVVHAPGDAHGPVHQEGRGDLAAGPQHLVELALGAVLHQDAVARGLSAHPPRQGTNHRG